MEDRSPNHYERAVENWLIDHHIKYTPIDEHERAAPARCKVKSFDFLLYPDDGRKIIAEVKGRKFRGTSFVNLTGLECWVTSDDVDGLAQWHELFSPDFQAVFVFAYKIENIDVDFDGHRTFDFDAGKYAFFCVRLDDYRRFMVLRSRKWQTITLPADKFRLCAVDLHDFLLNVI
jgi:hypothetical protein